MVFSEIFIKFNLDQGMMNTVLCCLPQCQCNKETAHGLATDSSKWKSRIQDARVAEKDPKMSPFSPTVYS